MKKLLLLSLLLFTFLVPFSAAAQDDTPEDDYTPLIFGDNVFSLLYPSAWTLDTDLDTGTFTFTSDPSILSREVQPYAAGEITVTLNLLMSAKPITNDDTLEPLLTNLLSTLRYGADGKLLSTFNPTIASLMPSAEGVPAIARATFSDTRLGEGMIYVWRITDEVVGLVVVNTAVGEISFHEPEVLTLIQSVRFNTTLVELNELAAQQQGSGS